jgi:hypothetical protein
MNRKDVNSKLEEILDQYKKTKESDTLLDKFIDDFFPKNPDKDPYWILGAQNLLKAIILSMLQDSKIAENAFNINTIKEISQLGTLDDPKDYENTKQTRIRAYFKNQSLEVRQLADAVISNPNNTFLNFVTTLYVPLARL